MNLDVLGSSDPAFAEAWSGLSGRQLSRAALYQPSSLAFYREQRQLEPLSDLSFVIASGKRGLLGVQMQAFRTVNGGVEVTCHGLPCLYGRSPDLSAGEHDAGGRMFKAALTERLAALGELEELVFRDHLDEGALSPLGHFLLGKGATCHPHLTQTVDLSQTEADLRAPFRKTVRWSINWGLKTLAIELLDAATVSDADIEAFHQLHIAVAGRETRTAATWQRQLDMVRAGDAFIVFGRLADELVTAALFITSASHCFYGVSASRRELFDKPLGHAIIWTAMLHARSRGVHWFELGEQSYPGLAAWMVSDKERGISFFKRSFGGASEVCLDVRLERARIEAVPGADHG